MKCLGCGCVSEHYLCPACLTVDTLDRVFREIRYFYSENCENPHLLEFASGFEDKSKVRDIIPDILGEFDSDISAFYYCQYYRMKRDLRFEDAAIAYLNTHKLEEPRTQTVLFDLIDSYLRKEFDKPAKWCELIVEHDGLCCELYLKAAEYFSMVGEYEKADCMVNRVADLSTSNRERRQLIYSSFEMITKALANRKRLINTYRTGSPYWPNDEDARRKLAEIYDRKGIKRKRSQRIKRKPKKIEECEFEPLNEYEGANLTDYCTFWCAETFGMAKSKSKMKLKPNGIYQIAAVKVRGNRVIDEFQEWIYPFDGEVERKDAAKKAGVDLSVIEDAEDVDTVMTKFFVFVGDDVLISTEALVNQGNLISRAARYTGKRSIKNEFCDLLDLAMDVFPAFDLENNTREYLLAHFAIEEGNDARNTALEKAKVNKHLYDALKDVK